MGFLKKNKKKEDEEYQVTEPAELKEAIEGKPMTDNQIDKQIKELNERIDSLGGQQQVASATPVPQVKKRIVVVRDYPTQIIKTYQAEDGTQIILYTLEDYLTAEANGEI